MRIHVRDVQEVVILVGYPSAGKSTWAQTNLVDKSTKYVVISGDDLKTIPKMIKVAKIQLDLGKSVVIDRTNPKVEDRAKFIELAALYKIPVRCVVFNVAIETAMEWNIKRLNETDKKVPRIAFYLFRKNYVSPTSDECELVLI